MFEIKEWTRIAPCVCGRIMRGEDDIYCSWCGRKVETEPDESTMAFIEETKKYRNAFEVWRKEHQPPEEAAGEAQED